jgi:hypothetical protein
MCPKLGGQSVVLAISHLFMGGVAFIPVKAEGVFYTDGLSFLNILSCSLSLSKEN